MLEVLQAIDMTPCAPKLIMLLQAMEKVHYAWRCVVMRCGIYKAADVAG